MKCPRAPNLHNAVTVSQQRLGKRVAQLREKTNSILGGGHTASLRFVRTQCTGVQKRHRPEKQTPSTAFGNAGKGNPARLIPHFLSGCLVSHCRETEALS